jgi:hypothetical protein
LASNCWNLPFSSFSSFCEAGCGFVAMFNYNVRRLGSVSEAKAERELPAEILSALNGRQG